MNRSSPHHFDGYLILHGRRPSSSLLLSWQSERYVDCKMGENLQRKEHMMFKVVDVEDKGAIVITQVLIFYF